VLWHCSVALCCGTVLWHQDVRATTFTAADFRCSNSRDRTMCGLQTPEQERNPDALK